MTLVPWVGAALAIGPAAFDLLAWGSIALVVLAFGYVVYALVADRRPS